MHKALREHTLNFWMISRTWHGRPVGKVTTEGALRLLGRPIEEINPKHLVVRRSLALRDAIIQGPVKEVKSSVGG